MAKDLKQGLLAKLKEFAAQSRLNKIIVGVAVGAVMVFGFVVGNQDVVNQAEDVFDSINDVSGTVP